MGDRLRASWDFGDLDGTERRFRELLEREPSSRGRAEVLTQLARVEGLRGRFEMGEHLVREAEALAGSDAVVRSRIDLERGRLRRSAGDPEGSAPLFRSAFASAQAAGDDFIAVDAAHMVAVAATEREDRLKWAERGIALAQSSHDPAVRSWLGPLLNNLGWERYGAGEYEQALEIFRRALRERERDPEKPAELEIARYAVGKTLRALGRGAEAAMLLEQAVGWAQAAGEPDGWFHEELAEVYAALGRDPEAREQATLALPLLLEQDASFEGDGARAARLRALASD
jgi:tetratricopeptide (TPR) repeat protein